ncbi:RICIN domain-containing protein [Pilimelia columellifera]|uniref:Uncharacterized protein n=1 Tax=Pilimelia columellifera subsp. columellifera TaxID=706583 RepID=A0ABN3NH86_9ACTN
MRQALFRPLRAAADGDRGSLVMAMLLTLVTVGLTAAMLPVILQQTNSTGLTITRGRELDAAHAGLALAQARIRAASDPATPGTIVQSRLPCNSPISGEIAPGPGTTAPVRYHVEIEYFGEDPLSAVSGPLGCAATGGPSATPRYARLNSWATVRGSGNVMSGGRHLAGTYAFNTIRTDFDPNLPRQVAFYSPPATLLGTFSVLLTPVLAAYFRQRVCLDVGTNALVPPAGTPVHARDCAAAGPRAQNFYYRSDLALVHAGSYSVNQPMCVDGGGVHAVGNPVTLQPCGSGAATWRHRWYYNGANNFEGVRPTAGGPSTDALDGFCLNRAKTSVAAVNDFPVTLGSAVNGACRKEIPDGLGAIDVFSDFLNAAEGYGLQSMSFLDDVGPGLAGNNGTVDCATEMGQPCRVTQLVNTGLRSMCVEYRAGELYGPMVTKECAQSPDPRDLDPDQLWRVPVPAPGQTVATGPIYQKGDDGRTYCLSSSDQILNALVGSLLGAATLNSNWPKFAGRAVCNPKTASGPLLWKVYGNTGNATTAYHIASNSTGRCLAVGEEADLDNAGLMTLIANVVKLLATLLGSPIPLPLDPYVYQWTGSQNNLKVILKTCGASDRQKWAGPVAQANMIDSPTAGAAATIPARPLGDIGEFPATDKPR